MKRFYTRSQVFEHYQYSEATHQDPPASPEIPYQPVTADQIAAMSLLIWGEHCVECAAPACYHSCDLYDPRPDMRCRRFVYGSFHNPRFPSLRGGGTEVIFKKWAKIEARGNTLLTTPRKVLAYERWIGRVAPAGDVAGKGVRTVTGDERWSYASQASLERLSRRLNQRGMKQKGESPDAFLLEVYNPMKTACRLQLSVSLSLEERQRFTSISQLKPATTMFIDLAPGYTRKVIERAVFESVTTGHDFDIALIPEADTAMHLVFLTADFVRFAKGPVASVSPATPGKDLKVIVWDLDHTLWHGILTEGDDVRLRDGIVDLLRHFDERGILHSISSRNDHDAAIEKLREFGIADYFLYPQINWQPKSQNLPRIAQRLNLGIDAFAFVDDNPFELDQVRSIVPEVTCFHVDEIATLRAHPRLHGSSSDDSRRRRQFYKEAIEREDVQAAFGGDYLAFLAASEIVLGISPYTVTDLERVAELVQRTNQLNFSGRKYSRAELDEIVANPELHKYVLRCEDRFGSYGTVGFCIARREDGRIAIEDFMLSCRVQSKFLEKALFDHIRRELSGEAALPVWVNFRATAKNKPAQMVLDDMGFEASAEGGRQLGPEADLTCAFIRVAKT